MSSKPIKAILKLQLKAAEAKPSPPLGPALGQHGVTIMDFVKKYNAATESMKGKVIPVEITIYEDRSYDFILKTPPAAELIKEKLGIPRGSGKPLQEKVGKITQAQLREIAEIKMPDLKSHSIDTAMKTIAGTARQMGVVVID